MRCGRLYRRRCGCRKDSYVIVAHTESMFRVLVQSTNCRPNEYDNWIRLLWYRLESVGVLAVLLADLIRTSQHHGEVACKSLARICNAIVGLCTPVRTILGHGRLQLND